MVLGDVAVRHPETRVRDVQEDVDDLAGTHQHRVLPHEILLGDAVAGKDDEAARAVDMERVVHRVVGIHLVHKSQLDLVADAELPGDRIVDCSGRSIDEVLAHVRGCRQPVDVDHVVFPLDAASVAQLVAVVWVAFPLVGLDVVVRPLLGVLLMSEMLLDGAAVSVMGVSFVVGVMSMSVAVTGVRSLRADVAVLMTLVVAVAMLGVRAVL